MVHDILGPITPLRVTVAISSSSIVTVVRDTCCRRPTAHKSHTQRTEAETTALCLDHSSLAVSRGYSGVDEVREMVREYCSLAVSRGYSVVGTVREMVREYCSLAVSRGYSGVGMVREMVREYWSLVVLRGYSGVDVVGRW